MGYYSQLVADQFFQLFYTERIEILKSVGRNYFRQIDTSILSFWFSVIDFYGGIYWVGINDRLMDQYDGQKRTLKLANKTTFSLFINDFFPQPENQLGDLLYSVFRSGLVHQLTPKKGAIVWDETNPRLLWIKVDSDNPNPETNKVATLNIFQLESLTYKAYKSFQSKVESGELETECAIIHNRLLSKADILEDGYVLNRECAALTPSYLATISV
jgi:hypothetical protein